VASNDPTGSLETFINHLIPMGFHLPPELTSKYGGSAHICVNDQHVFVVSHGGILIFRKSDKTWHKWDVPSDVIPMVRGFGRYLAYSEWRLGIGETETPGKKEWRAEEDDGGLGPPTNRRLQGGAFPGHLMILDTDTMQQFLIDTKQGDSEVLLIEDGIVYYRAATRLYSAPIKDKTVGPSTLLATAEMVRDAHWAFIKR
jgi:hypothetical protein